MSSRLRGAVLCVAVASVVACCAPSSRAQSAPPGPGSAREARRPLVSGLRLVRHYLRSGQVTPYVAQQTTRLLEGRIRESRQIVKHAGPARERIEYTAPATLRGGIVLTVGERMYQFVRWPTPRLLHGYVNHELSSGGARGLLAALREGRLRVRVVGQEEVAGRTAAILELRGQAGEAAKRIWIDLATGVRLRTDSMDAQGAVLATSYFTAIDYHPTFSRRDFVAESLPSAPVEPAAPRSRPLARLEEAQALAPFAIKEPDLPAVFVRQGIWVIGRDARASVVMSYSDGLNLVIFAQRRVPDAKRTTKQRAASPRTGSGRAVHWWRGDMLYSLVGQVPAHAARRVIASTE